MTTLDLFQEYKIDLIVLKKKRNSSHTEKKRNPYRLHESMQLMHKNQLRKSK